MLYHLQLEPHICFCFGQIQTSVHSCVVEFAQVVQPQPTTAAGMNWLVYTLEEGLPSEDLTHQ